MDNRENQGNESNKKRKKSKAPYIIANIVLAALVVVILVKTFGKHESTYDPNVHINTTKVTTIPESKTSDVESTDTITTSTTISTQKSTEPLDHAYKDTIQKDRNTWNLILVNQWNPVGKSYKPPLLTYSEGREIDERIQKDLTAIVKASKEAGLGLNIFPQSMYRSYEKQVYLFNAKTKQYLDGKRTREEAEKKASEVVARPGTSEHHTGLAVDFLFAKHTDLIQDYEYTKEYEWMMENCANYGFILRFPKGKEKVTGVIFEPWHYRYVGREAAKIIMKKGMTLEEYIDDIEQ